MKLVSTIYFVILNKSLYDFFNIVLSYLYTKLFFNNAKMIRLPIYRTKMGHFKYGEKLSIGPSAIIDIVSKDGELVIGNRFNAYHRLHIGVLNKVTIGDDVLIASNVYISDCSHGWYRDDNHSNPLTAPNDRPLQGSAVSIGNKVWLGEGVMVLPGVNIGDGSIVGAGSIVTKSIPNYCIAIGNPAKVVKKYDFQISEWKSI